MTIDISTPTEINSEKISADLVADIHPWFLAYTRPGQESVAQQHLNRQAFDSYLPQYKRLKKSPTGMETVVEPMFPRYVFFRPQQPQQSIVPVRSTRGISHIIRFGSVFATVQPETLGIIRLLEQERNAGDGTDDAALGSLLPGQKVRFLHVAFRGLEGLVKATASRRVAVLLELMGRQQLIQVDQHQLEPI